jgi:molybdate transport system regulatory protein
MKKTYDNKKNMEPTSTRRNDEFKLSRLLSPADDLPCLDTVELKQLEDSFRAWVEETLRSDIRFSRLRVLLVFLIIRYTGAKLNEVLAIEPTTDIDFDRMAISYKASEKISDSDPRKVEIPETLSNEIRSLICMPDYHRSSLKTLGVDPGFIRRKFYERAEACGFQKNLGGPEMIRRARAVELMKNNMPLPAVQMMLGHSLPNLTSAYVTFSKEDIQRMTRHYLDRESSYKTSARNSFYGKVSDIRRGDIQSHVIMTTLNGDTIGTMITNDSLSRMGLIPGKLVKAEIKAPWIILQKSSAKPPCTADNILKGTITRINTGALNTEYTAKIDDGTEMCSIVSTESSNHLDLSIGDSVWILFTCYTVVLRVD